METLAVFIYPEKIGLARVKAPGAKPSYSSLQWRLADNVQQLLSEPMLLAGLVREMVGDDKKYNLYLNVWPGAYSAVMFSYDKKGRADLNRLRQAELETVFRGELSKLYTLDLSLNKGQASADGKSHRIIFTSKKEQMKLMKESFAAQHMTLQRVAPMDVAAAESAMRYWNPKDKNISVFMVLDEGCTSVIFLKGGVLHTMRTLPNGFNSVLASYEMISGLDHDACLDMIRQNGVHSDSETFHMPTIQDDVLRMLNRVTAETVKTLHNTFGDDAVIERVMLCGNFVPTVGLVEYLNTMLETECIVAGTDTLGPQTSAAISLDEKDFTDLFPLAATASAGADLMYEMKKQQRDKVQSTLVCSVATVLVAGFMVVTPIEKHALQTARDAAAAELEKPEFTAVRALFDQRDQLNRDLSALQTAIEELPHGATNTAGFLQDLYDLTAEYGTVLSLTSDYSTKSITISFTTLNYDSFVYWQKAVTDGGRFSFVQPPTFSGNGLVYTVESQLTATDFDPVAESDTADVSAEGIG